jgi:ankyrin repeat protein
LFNLAVEGNFLPAVAAISQKSLIVDSIAEVENSFTLLHAAAYYGNAQAVATLLKLGADPD